MKEQDVSNIFSNVTQSPSDGQVAFSSCSLSEAVPECRLGKSLSIADTCKSEGIKWKRSSIWQQASGQNLLTRHFSAPEKPSQLVPSSPSASASDRGSTGLPLAPDLHWSYLPCLSARTKLSLFHNIRRRPSQMQSCIKGTSSDSASLYFSLRKPTICWSLTSFFRVNCLSFLHESEQFHHSF